MDLLICSSHARRGAQGALIAIRALRVVKGLPHDARALPKSNITMSSKKFDRSESRLAPYLYGRLMFFSIFFTHLLIRNPISNKNSIRCIEFLFKARVLNKNSIRRIEFLFIEGVLNKNSIRRIEFLYKARVLNKNSIRRIKF